jgi:uncharacterized protein
VSAGRGARVELIDALRAFALFGILQINIQSFLWGAGDPLGAFRAPPDTADGLLYIATATLVAGKFISLFALLFGLGFALQWRGLRRSGLDADRARAAYRRRLAFLLAVGIAHGTLLYYGDILTAYALAGFVLLLHAGQRPAALARTCRNWWLAFAALLALNLLLPADGAPGAAALRERFALYATGSYAAQWDARLEDYGWTTLASAVFGLPFLLGLFTLGALAGRLGWLTHPQRHPRVWRAAWWLGLAALPVAVAAAWINFAAASEARLDVLGFTLAGLSTPVAALYLAAIVRWRAAPPVAAAIRWLAPAGRMPLTNYLMQSVLMGVLLAGWGLGWGEALGRGQLALLALAIVVVQVAASRVWIARYGSGPVEALWRAFTYPRAAR